MYDIETDIDNALEGYYITKRKTSDHVLALQAALNASTAVKELKEAEERIRALEHMYKSHQHVVRAYSEAQERIKELESELQTMHYSNSMRNSE